MTVKKMVPTSDLAVVWQCPEHGDQFTREGFGSVSEEELADTGPELCPICSEPMTWRTVKKGYNGNRT